MQIHAHQGGFDQRVWKITSVGKYEDTWESGKNLGIAGKNFKKCNHCGKQIDSCSEGELSYDPTCSLLGVQPKALKGKSQADTYILMLTALWYLTVAIR